MENPENPMELIIIHIETVMHLTYQIRAPTIGHTIIDPTIGLSVEVHP